MARAVNPQFFCLAAFVAVSSLLLLPVGLSGPAHSQSAAKGKPVDGRKTVIAGVKAYEAGRANSAVTTLSKAIRSGGLSTTDMAKALYYRGLANNKAGKSADAIADLTNAVWMKGGLTPSEQQKALETRAKAYAKVGVKDPGPPKASLGTPSVQSASVAPAKAQAAKATKKAAAVVPASKTTAATPSSFQTSVKKGGAGAQPDPSSGSGAGQTSNPLSGVGNFFSNLFGGNGSSQQTAPSSTASIDPKPALGGTNTAVSAWSSNTSVAQSQKRASSRPTSKPVVKRVAAVSAPKGRYRLQVAAVRSRGEAERLAGSLRQKHAGQIGSRIPAITEKVFGNMGTFYQVNVGPYAKTSETDRVCRVLKADGFDCLVVKK